MSAYAALVSLRKTLVTILYPRWRIIFNRGELQNLLEEAGLLLDFLDNSSAYEASQISALETKMRDAAHKAEDLIEHWTLDPDRRVSHDSVTIIPACGIILGFYTFLSVFIPWSILVQVIFCATDGVFLYLWIREKYGIPSTNTSQEWRRVLYDFKIIVQGVVQIKEAPGDPEMSADAALISLEEILDSILHSGGLRMYRYRTQLKSLHEKVSFLLDFLGRNASTPTLQNLDVKIRDAVYKAKSALIEFQLPSKHGLEFDWSCFATLWCYSLIIIPATLLIYYLGLFLYYLRIFPPVIMPSRFEILRPVCIAFAFAFAFVVLAALNVSWAPENQELPHVVYDFHIIVIKIKDAYGYGNPSDLPAATAALSRQDSGGTDRNVVVGLDGDMKQIKARLLQDSSKRELVSIVGMGGIGKTTLARLVYIDPDILTRFDARAWVTVSHEYSLRHVLLCLLDSAHVLIEDMHQDNDDKLGQYLHQYLMWRRYLIVVDDAWDTGIWDSLSRFFPENCNGSRVLLTSRLTDVASYPDSGSPLHQMQCLNDDDSWGLLCRKVFGAEDCPLELESIGREITQKCGGIPLAIVVVGGLLYKKTQVQVWRDVAEKLKKSELEDMKEQCLEILGLSYNHLPHHLRPCFLYMGVFLGNCEIPISRLINLWVAEGFLKPYKSQDLEEVAEAYLEDLIDRNLIFVCKRSCNGKIRTCSIHDLLRDVCVQTARKENFIHVVDSGGYVTRERPDESPHRLSIHPDALQVNARHYLKSRFDNVRSVLCTASNPIQSRQVNPTHDSRSWNDCVRYVLCIASKPKPIENPLVFYLGSVYLRVLDVLEVHFGEFPHQITKLLRLRYLALHYDGSLPPSISKLQNLETIVHHHSSFRKYPLLRWVIWSMPNLRHLIVKPSCYLSNPLRCRSLWDSSILVHLQTLVGIRNFKWTKGIIKRIPNLKKLVISYNVSSRVDWSTYQLENLVYLHRLETLKIIVKYADVGSAMSHDPPKLAFPQKLRKLSLSGCGIPWASMDTIGALPNLEALKLRCNAFCGPSWETVEGEFPQLIFLLLEEMSLTRWETDAAHFPRLQRLVIRSCGMLQEIPSAIGDIPTLEVIELVDCHASVVASAKEIQEEQESMGNEGLKFRIEQRRREVDEMNLGNLDARGGPGLFQALSDIIESPGIRTPFTRAFLVVLELILICCSRWSIIISFLGCVVFSYFRFNFFFEYVLFYD